MRRICNARCARATRTCWVRAVFWALGGECVCVCVTCLDASPIRRFGALAFLILKRNGDGPKSALLRVRGHIMRVCITSAYYVRHGHCYHCLGRVRESARASVKCASPSASLHAQIGHWQTDIWVEFFFSQIIMHAQFIAH